MNVAELIEQLRQFPPDLTVTVQGYDGGATEGFDVGAVYVEPNGYADSEWMGEHEPIVLAPDERIEVEYPNRMPVLCIARSSSGFFDYTIAAEVASCDIEGCNERVPVDVAYCQPHADAEAWKVLPLRST